MQGNAGLASRWLAVVALSMSGLVAPGLAQAPLGTEFTFQGRLAQNGQPFDGSVDLTFRLFDAASGGVLVGTQGINNVPVTEGNFSALLNAASEFGPDAFSGDARWLEIVVNGQTLSPRQPVTAAPYALFSLASAGGGGGCDPWTCEGTNIRNTNAGSVGIGLPAGALPEGDLHIRGRTTTGRLLVTPNAADQISEILLAENTSASLGMILRFDGTSAGGNAFSFLGLNSDVESLPYLSITRSAGNVGIGTAIPVSRLHLDGDSLWISGTDSGGLGSAAGAGIRLFNQPGAGNIFAYDYVASMPMPLALQALSGANLGVGTVTPLTKAHIATINLSIPAAALASDQLIVEGQDAYLGLFSPGGTGYGSAIALREMSAGALVDTWGVVRRDSGASNPSLRFTYGSSASVSSNSTLMSLTPTGELGIGLYPTQKLSVAGTIQSTTGGFMFPDGTVQTTASSIGPGFWSSFGFHIYNNNTGNVGIGTSTPVSPLHIRRNLGAPLDLRVENPNGHPSSSARLVLETDALGEAIIGLSSSTDADKRLEIKASGLAPIVLDSNVEVAIRNGTETRFAFLTATSNAQLDMYDGDQNREFRLEADGGNSAATLTMYAADATPTVTLMGDEGDGGAQLNMKNAAGADSLVLDGNQGAAGGSGITMYNGAGTLTVDIDSDVGSTHEGWIGIYRSGGTSPVIELDALTSAGDAKITTGVLEITGGGDFAELFDVEPAATDDPASSAALDIVGESGAATAPAPGMVVCIDPQNPGKLIVASRAYDHTVAGVISGAGGVKPGMVVSQDGTIADGAHPVALTGRVYVACDASDASIRPGDLLTTSDIPGHAMAVRDREAASGAVLGKAMTSLESGRGLVLVLVSLQ